MTLYTGNIVDTQVIAVSSSSVGIDLTGLDQSATGCRCTVEGGDIRVRVDGGDPTGVFGHIELDGSSFTIVGSQNVADLRMIASDGEAGATVTVSLMQGATL